MPIFTTKIILEPIVGAALLYNAQQSLNSCWCLHFKRMMLTDAQQCKMITYRFKINIHSSSKFINDWLKSLD